MDLIWNASFTSGLTALWHWYLLKGKRKASQYVFLDSGVCWSFCVYPRTYYTLTTINCRLDREAVKKCQEAFIVAVNLQYIWKCNVLVFAQHFQQYDEKKREHIWHSLTTYCRHNTVYRRSAVFLHWLCHFVDWRTHNTGFLSFTPGCLVAVRDQLSIKVSLLFCGVFLFLYFIYIFGNMSPVLSIH